MPVPPVPVPAATGPVVPAAGEPGLLASNLIVERGFGCLAQPLSSSKTDSLGRFRPKSSLVAFKPRLRRPPHPLEMG